MSNQTEAQRIASDIHSAVPTQKLCQEAAAELRRLAAENLRLAGEVANRNARALAGDKATAVLEQQADRFLALEAENAALRADAERWNKLRLHWKTVNFTWDKTPANKIKTMTLVLDFTRVSQNGSEMIDRQIDAAMKEQP